MANEIKTVETARHTNLMYTLEMLLADTRGKVYTESVVFPAPSYRAAERTAEDISRDNGCVIFKLECTPDAVRSDLAVLGVC